MYFDAVVIGKAADPEKRARGAELEYLPFGMGGEQGPTAWREPTGSMTQSMKANIQADLIREIIREMKRPIQLPGTKKRLRRLLYDYQATQNQGG